jgi:hypothetical protein
MVGVSGAGKTLSALLIAKAFGGNIAVIDTENRSASLYMDVVPFSVLDMKPPYHPNKYIELIKEAEAEGFTTLIIDSISPEWDGVGGMLELHKIMTDTRARGNSFTAWHLVNPFHLAFVNAILQSQMHIIVTIKQKSDYVISMNDNGKQVPQKVGMKPVQREGFEYEYTVVLDLQRQGHYASASKDRTRLFTEDMPFVVTENTGVMLRDWLMSNELPAEEMNDHSMTLPPSQQDSVPLDVSRVENVVPSGFPEEANVRADAYAHVDADESEAMKAVGFSPTPELTGRVERWIARAVSTGSFKGAIGAAKKEYPEPEAFVYVKAALVNAAKEAGLLDTINNEDLVGV